MHDAAPPAHPCAACRLVDDAHSAAADLWLINTCTVKSPSQSAMDTVLRRGRAAGKALLVAGCVPQGDRRTAELRGLSLLGVTQIDRVVEAVEETLKGHTVRLLAKKALPRLDLPKASATSLSAQGAGEQGLLCWASSAGWRARSSSQWPLLPAGAAQSAHRDPAALYRLPGRMHLLQDQARARPAGLVRPPGAGQARGGGGS